MIKKDNFGTRSNSKLAASGPIKAGTTNANLGGKSVVARANTPAQDPNLGRLVLTTIIQDIPKYSIDGEGAQVAINYTSLQIPKEKELRHPLVAGIQVSLVSGNFSQLITITSTLALNDTTISVASFNPNVDIGKGALICIDEEDLFNQYQNKTKGTIAGFTIDADGIAKSGIEITDWLNSDTMTGASVNNVPTALSVKNYVDNSHPAEDQTLQEVTDNGNTTTNSVMIGSSSSPSRQLHIHSTSGSAYIQLTQSSTGTTSQDGFQIAMGASQVNLINRENGNIVFETNNAERMRLTSTGNLGIGTTSPTHKLMVVSGTTNVTSVFKSEDNQAWISVQDDDSGTYGALFGTDTDAGHSIVLADKSAVKRLVIDNSGNVGIGTSSPSELLEVSGKGLFESVDIFKVDASANPRLRIGRYNAETLNFDVDDSIARIYHLQDELSATVHQLNITVDSESTAGAKINLGFRDIDGTNESTKFTVLDTGLVGIGTSSPTHKLDISGGKIQINDGGATWFGSDGTGGFVRTFNGNTFRFLDSSGGETMRIDNTNDRVGIGTSSPSDELEVYKNGSDVAIRIHEDAGTHEARLHLRRGGSDWELINNYNFTIEGEGVERFRIDTAGLVGIGTSSPVYKLDVRNTGNLFYGQTDLTDTTSIFRIRANGGSNDVFDIHATGNIGIGTSSPASKLHVAGKVTISDNQYLSWSTNSRIVANSSYMQFQVAATDKMRILADGNVGIGSTSPNRLLTLSASGGTYQAFNSTSNNNTTIGSDGTGAFVVYDDTASSYRMVVKETTGNVLIGTTTDSGAKLNVVGGNLRVDNTGSTSDYSEITERQFQVTRSGSSSGMELQTLGTYSGSGGFIDLKPKNTTAMRIAGDGNVLIGTTTDIGGKLTIQNDNSGSNTTGIYLKNSSAVNGGISIDFDNSSSNNVSARIASLRTSSTNFGTALTFNTAESVAIGEKMRLTSGGNLLIGTTTDSGAKLNVVGSATTNTDIATFGNSNSVSKIKLSLDGVGSSKLTMLDSSNNEDIILSTQGNSVFANQLTIPATPVATTDAASKSYVDSQVAEAGTSSFGSFTPASTQSIASGGNVGVKSTLLLATSQVTASNITTSSAGLTFANAGLYQISFNFASKVSGTANRTLAAANLEYSTDGETWTEIVGSLVYNYDRGTATSGGASSWGFVYDGSASCSFIHNLATSSIIRARFWIEGRASSASGITTIINGCRLSAHKIG